MNIYTELFQHVWDTEKKRKKGKHGGAAWEIQFLRTFKDRVWKKVH